MKGDNTMTTMKRICVLVVTILAAAASTRAGEPLKIYILAGQSNMEGQAAPETLAGIGMDPKTKPLYDKLVDKDGKPRVCKDVSIVCFNGKRDDPVIKQGPLTFGYGGALREDKPRMGVEFAFGVTVHEKLKQPILIIKTAWGGKSLHTDFRPPSAGPYYADPGQVKDRKTRKGIVTAAEIIAKKEKAQHAYYNAMVKHVNTVLADPGKYCPAYDTDAGYEIAGFVWFQGFNDMIDGGTYNLSEPDGYALYSELLAHFIRDVRKDFKAPKMPFVIGVIGMGGEHIARNDKQMYLRKAMAAPADMPAFKANVVAVQTAPFWDHRIDEILEIGSIVKTPDHRRGNKAAYAERDPEGTYAEQHAKYQQWYKAMMAKAPDKKKDRRAWRLWNNKLKAEKDAHAYTPEELNYLKANRSNAKLHYWGSGTFYSRAGEAFARAMFRDETVYLLESGDAGKEGVKLTWLKGRIMPASATVFCNGKKIGTADPAKGCYIDKRPPRGVVHYRVEFTLPDGTTRSLETTFPGRLEDLTGALGLLDVMHNDGINPATGRTWRVGDSYRLVFVSSEKTDATSPDLATYDDFVTQLAGKVGIGGSWKVIGSAEGSNIQEHTQTVPDLFKAAVPLFQINGKTRVADSYSDLWDGPLDAPINRTETGQVLKEGLVFTGANVWGLGNKKRVDAGDLTSSARLTWIRADKISPKKTRHVYAISDILKVKLK